MPSREEMVFNEDMFNKIIQETTVEGIEENRLVNVLYGLSPFQSTVLPKVNDDDKIHVFFTRPDMNLSQNNIVRDRTAIGIQKNNESIQKYIRLLLDQKQNVDTTSSVLDAHNPFIPIASNLLETMSGFPDIVLESWISKTGIRKEQWGYGDGYTKIHYTFNLDATFTNVIDEPIPLLISTWMNYISNVREGVFMPHVHNLSPRRTDYQTAIWVIVTNKNKRIKKIARTIAYPIADPKGRNFNFTRNESKLNEGSKVNVRFKCFGVEYNDPILLLEFNTLMMSAHPKIKDVVMNGGTGMKEIPDSFRNKFKYRAYPFIDLKYNTLEYLVDEDQIKIKAIPDE